MKYLGNYRSIALLLISILNYSLVTHTTVVPYATIRSQGAYASRYQAGLYPFLNPDTYDTYTTVFAINTGYNRSFNNQQITQNFFGTNHCNGITISGSRVENRGPQDWLADYFMLPNDFKSAITFSPTIDSFLIDFNWILSLDPWISGAYFALYAPIVHTRVDLNMCEKVQNYGVNAQPEGIFAPTDLNRGALLENFTSYAQGNLVQPIQQTIQAPAPASDSKLFLSIFQQLKQAKISPLCKKDTGIADIRCVLGWNWLQNNYHLGFNFQAVAPAGTSPKGEFIGEAIIGNSHHWEVGGGVNGHYDLWKSNDETKKCSLYAHATFTHLFNSEQSRTFDLKQSPLSRYMLAQRMDIPITNNLRAAGETPKAQFKQELTPLANLSTIKVAVSTLFQTDVIIGAHLTYDKVDFDIGYNFWYRSKDHILARGVNAIDSEVWALKGDAQVFGFASAANADPSFPLFQGQPVALSATQSAATIYGGTNLPPQGGANQLVFNTARQNPNIDAPQPAAAGGSAIPPLTSTPLNTLPIGGIPINTSLNPILITSKDLDLCSAATQGITSSIFTHCQYTGNELKGYTPQIGLGGQAEFAHKNKNNNACDRVNTALSQWQVWLKIGFSF